MAATLAAKKKKTAFVIWCHGLGDSGASWTGLPKALSEEAPWVRWSFPDAPIQPVTCNEGKSMRTWFDMRTIAPVVELETHTGMQDSVIEVHKMIQQAEAFGFSRDRLILGGFSQGGCLALHAGLTVPGEPIGGIVAFSGWIGAGLKEDIVHEATPILISHGRADSVVPLSAMEKSMEVLKSAGCSAIRHEWIDGLEHSTVPPQMDLLTRFILELVPKDPLPAPVPLKADRHATWVDGDSCKIAIWLSSMAGVKVEVSSSGVRLSGAVQPVFSVAWAAPAVATSANARFVKTRSVLRVEAPKEA